MPTFNARITGFAAGDDIEIRRTIDRDVSGLDSGVTISKAWFTVKTNPSIDDADDSDAIIQKEITAANSVDVGQIEDDGTGDTDPVLRFDLTDANTREIGITHRKYDIQVLTSTGKVYTGEIGEIWGTTDVTIDIA